MILFIPSPTFFFPVQFMNAFPVYPAVGFGTPLMYSPLMMAPQTPLQTQSNKLPNTIEKAASKFQRPASQATSVKAEPGSVMGSMVKNGHHLHKHRLYCWTNYIFTFCRCSQNARKKRKNQWTLQKWKTLRTNRKTKRKRKKH